jgi:hypothetical protein
MQGFQDLGDHVGGSNQVHIMTTSPLQRDHHCCQFFRTHLTALPKLTDGEVLAEDTGQIAVGEENGP